LSTSSHTTFIILAEKQLFPTARFWHNFYSIPGSLTITTMKKVWSKGLVMMVVTLLMSGFTPFSVKAQGSVSLQVFYDELQPHGAWMQHTRFGYVWSPRVERGFVPYSTNGYWINTEYGNTWVSDYSWGWAPFHYGRWFYDDFHGWIWIPDTEWAPAWVAWRGGGGYYGWAPLMPGYGINMSVSYYHRMPHYYWNFVPNRYITYRTVHHHCVPRTQVINIINNTTVITHNYTDSRSRTYFTGPSRGEMERTGRTRVDVYRIEERSRPGRADIDRGTVSFYKPEIDNARETRTRAIPSQYVRENGNGIMEKVESRKGQATDFSRERSGEKSWSGTEYNSRPDNRGTDSKSWRQSETDRSESTEEWKKSPTQPYRSMDTRNENESAYKKNNDFNRDDRSRDRGFESQKPANRFDSGSGTQRSQTYQRERDQVEQKSMNRVPVQQSQRTQLERPQSNYQRSPSSERESPNFQQQRLPQNNSRTMQRNDQEIRRSSPQSKSYQPVQRGTSTRERGSSKK
jgi:hypothetical protein